MSSLLFCRNKSRLCWSVNTDHSLNRSLRGISGESTDMGESGEWHGSSCRTETDAWRFNASSECLKETGLARESWRATTAFEFLTASMRRAVAAIRKPSGRAECYWALDEEVLHADNSLGNSPEYRDPAGRIVVKFVIVKRMHSTSITRTSPCTCPSATQKGKKISVTHMT